MCYSLWYNGPTITDTYEPSSVIFTPKTFYWMSPHCSHDLDSFRMRGCMASYLSLAVQVQSPTRSEPSPMDSTKCLQDSVVPVSFYGWTDNLLEIFTAADKKIVSIILWIHGPPLWSSGQSFWLQVQRSRVRFPGLPDLLSSSGSGTGSTQPREVNWRATWIKSSGSGPENRD